MSLKKFLNNLEIYLAAVVFSVMLVVIVVQVATRIAGHPIAWAEEAARYLMVWGCCLGIAAGTQARSHVSIDSIVDHLPFKPSYVIRMIMDVIVLACLVFVFIQGCKFTGMAMKSGQLMPALQKPIWVVYLAYPVGFALSIVRQVINLVGAVKDPKGRCGIVETPAEAEEVK